MSERVHFITVGNSRDHLIKAIEGLGIGQLVLFTSPQLRSEVEGFCSESLPDSVRVLELVDVYPFSSNSIESMVHILILKHDQYSKTGHVKVVVGLTGGTNLMAISMGLFALIKGLPCHYILNQAEGNVIEIATFQELQKLGDLENISEYLEAWK